MPAGSDRSSAVGWWRRLPTLIGLARRRLRSPADYRALQRLLATIAVNEIEARGVSLATRDVLELGAGPGGYSQILRPRCRRLLASDLRPGPRDPVGRDPVGRDPVGRDPVGRDPVGRDPVGREGIPCVCLDAQAPYPLSPASFDLVFCSNLIEHLARPEAMLEECLRVLRHDGHLYLSFPPFYSLALIGGHQFKPFHLLGERFAIRLHNWRRRPPQPVRDYASCYGTFGLHPLTIDRVTRLLRAAGFELTATWTRASPFDTTRLPGISRDLLTWHACFLARPAGSPNHRRTVETHDDRDRHDAAAGAGAVAGIVAWQG